MIALYLSNSSNFNLFFPCLIAINKSNDDSAKPPCRLQIQKLDRFLCVGNSDSVFFGLPEFARFPPLGSPSSSASIGIYPNCLECDNNKLSRYLFAEILAFVSSLSIASRTLSSILKALVLRGIAGLHMVIHRSDGETA